MDCFQREFVRPYSVEGDTWLTIIILYMTDVLLFFFWVPSVMDQGFLYKLRNYMGTIYEDDISRDSFLASVPSLYIWECIMFLDLQGLAGSLDQLHGAAVAVPGSISSGITAHVTFVSVTVPSIILPATAGVTSHVTFISVTVPGIILPATAGITVYARVVPVTFPPSITCYYWYYCSCYSCCCHCSS